jgi:hypothetical protein
VAFWREGRAFSLPRRPLSADLENCQRTGEIKCCYQTANIFVTTLAACECLGQEKNGGANHDLWVGRAADGGSRGAGLHLLHLRTRLQRGKSPPQRSLDGGTLEGKMKTVVWAARLSRQSQRPHPNVGKHDVRMGHPYCLLCCCLTGSMNPQEHAARGRCCHHWTRLGSMRLFLWAHFLMPAEHQTRFGHRAG